MNRAQLEQWCEDHGELELLGLPNGLGMLDIMDMLRFSPCPDCGEKAKDYRDGQGCEFCRQCPICGRTLESDRCVSCLEYGP